MPASGLKGKWEFPELLFPYFSLESKLRCKTSFPDQRLRNRVLHRQHGPHQRRLRGAWPVPQDGGQPGEEPGGQADGESLAVGGNGTGFCPAPVKSRFGASRKEGSWGFSISALTRGSENTISNTNGPKLKADRYVRKQGLCFKTSMSRHWNSRC